MKLKLLKYLLIFPLPVNSLAEIPNTFTANTPAKAEEVNENFNYLYDEIEKLKNPESSSAGQYDCPTPATDYPYNYNYKSAPLGTSIYVGDTEYKLTKFAVNDPINSDTYHITMPIIVSNQTSPTTTKYVSFSPSVSTVNNDFICKDSLMFGGLFLYNIKNGFNIVSSLRYTNDGDDDTSSYYDNRISKYLQYHATVAFGNSSTTIAISHPSKIEQEKLVNSGDYDFTDDQMEFTPEFTQQIEELTNFLDHIRIEKVE
tara:strand:+ start:72 stop:845 length:774 start_codon:yes stop_codon:yes gene_type:complete